MLRSPLVPNPKFFSSKSRKAGKSKQKKLNLAQSPAAGKSKQKNLSGAQSPEPPPIPLNVFPYYSSSSSTPLPLPSMPKKRFFRRVFPFLLIASGAYVLLRPSNKDSSEKDEKIRTEMAPFTVGSIDAAVAVPARYSHVAEN